MATLQIGRGAADPARDFPRVQIATVEELMAGVQPRIPYGQTTFTKAGRVRTASGQQGLDLG